MREGQQCYEITTNRTARFIPVAFKLLMSSELICDLLIRSAQDENVTGIKCGMTER